MTQNSHQNVSEPNINSLNFDTSSDLNQIKVNIEEIKKSVDFLKKDIEDLEKNKNSLAKEILDQKQKDIDLKKAEIERKKKETQDLILKIRKEWVDLKLEALDENIKKILEEKKKQDEILLAQYEKELLDIKPENDSWWTKTKNRISETWNGLPSAGKWALGIGAGALTLWGLFSLFKGKDEDEDSESEEGGKKKKKKRKGFWNTGFGKILKWVGIGIGGFLGIKFLIDLFGKNKDSNNQNTTNENPIRSSVETREKLPEDLKLKYNEVGTHIKGMYKNIFQDEMRGTDTPDELVVAKDSSTGQEKTLPSGIFVGTMDSLYSNVGQILSTKSVYSDGLSGKIDEFINSVKEKLVSGVKEVGKFFAPFVGLFGLTTNMFDQGGNATSEFQNWILDSRMERKEQIAFILRQYARIRVFLYQKELLLRRKLTAQKLGLQDITDPQVDEYLEKEDFQKDITETIEKVYRNKKIITQTGDDAVSILKQYSIFDDSYDPTVQEKIKSINEEQQSEITDPMNTLLESMQNVSDSDPLPSSAIKDIENISKNFQESVKDEAWEDNWWDTFMGWAPLDVWLNTERQDRKAFMEAIGYNRITTQFLQRNNELLTKIQSGKGTKKDLLELKEVMESFYFLQKEVALGAELENVKDSERGFGEKIILTIQSFGVWEFVIIGGMLYVSAKFPTARRVIKWSLMLPVTVIKESSRRGLRNFHLMDNMKITRYLRHFAFRNEKTFMNYFRKGKISMAQAEMILRRAHKNGYRWVYNNLVDLIQKEFFAGNMPSQKFFINGSKRVMDIKDVQRFFDKSYPLRKFMMQADDKVLLIKNLFEYENIMNNAIGNKKLVMEEILKLAKFENIADIGTLAKKIQKLDVTLFVGLSPKQISKLARAISMDGDLLSNLAKLTDKINEIKKISTVVNTLTSFQKTCKTLIQAQIVSLQNQLRAAKGLEHRAFSKMIQQYEEILKNIANFSDDEAKFLTQLINTSGDMRYFSRILSVSDSVTLIKQLKKAGTISEFETILKQTGKFDTLINTLKNSGKFNEFFRTVKNNISLIDGIVTTLSTESKLLKFIKAFSKIPL